MRLRAHAEVHFGAEERLMERAQFPARDCHADEHGGCWPRCTRCARWWPTGDTAVGRELALALIDWFPGHSDYWIRPLPPGSRRSTAGGAPVVLRRAQPAASIRPARPCAVQVEARMQASQPQHRSQGGHPCPYARTANDWREFVSGCLDFRPEDRVFRVARAMFTEPELFELEMELIFEKNWIYACHESEIRQNHDYMTMQAGRQPLIITRDGDGQLNAIDQCLRAPRHHADAGEPRPPVDLHLLLPRLDLTSPTAGC